MDKPSNQDVWQVLGRIEQKLDTFHERLGPVETFARNYQADRNRVLGGIVAVSLFAAFIIGGVKAWVTSWFPGA